MENTTPSNTPSSLAPPPWVGALISETATIVVLHDVALQKTFQPKVHFVYQNDPPCDWEIYETAQCVVEISKTCQENDWNTFVNRIIPGMDCKINGFRFQKSSQEILELHIQGVFVPEKKADPEGLPSFLSKQMSCNEIFNDFVLRTEKMGQKLQQLHSFDKSNASTESRTIFLPPPTVIYQTNHKAPNPFPGTQLPIAEPSSPIFQSTPLAEMLLQSPIPAPLADDTIHPSENSIQDLVPAYRTMGPQDTLASPSSTLESVSFR
eukprot:Sdes_comp19708_c0_seq1m11639